MIDIQIGLLYDFYGKLLTQKQQDIMHMYFENDYSFSEIAQDLSVSRQAVYDTVKKTKKTLLEYETQLGLVSKFWHTQKGLEKIKEIVNELRKNNEDKEANAKTLHKLDEIEQVIMKIEQIEVK